MTEQSPRAMFAFETTQPGVVTGTPNIMLRIEGLAVFIGATYAYSQQGLSWWLYAILALAPDLSMLGYLGGTRRGAVCYNAVHTYVVSILLAAMGIVTNSPLAIGIATIWIAHIAFDRMIGVGLKYADAFGHTHLSASPKSANPEK